MHPDTIKKNPPDLYTKKELKLDLRDIDRSARICRALSSEIRLKILQALIARSMTISQLAKMFYLPVSSMSQHIHILMEAELVLVVARPGVHGTKKVCAISASLVSFDLFTQKTPVVRRTPAHVYMPIGNYVACEIEPPCGIVSQDYYLYTEDSPYGFYMPSHVSAALLWFKTGYVEYRFPNEALLVDKVSYVEFSFEICSKAPGYNNAWPSDIDLLINDTKVVTIRIKGDYGGRRGIYNPSWWGDANTQYGDYKSLRISDAGCFMDEQKVSAYTLSDLGMAQGYCFSFRLGVDPGAHHAGGMNLFGRHFGDYAQDIIMKVCYE